MTKIRDCCVRSASRSVCDMAACVALILFSGCGSIPAFTICKERQPILLGGQDLVTLQISGDGKRVARNLCARVTAYRGSLVCAGVQCALTRDGTRPVDASSVVLRVSNVADAHLVYHAPQGPVPGMIDHITAQLYKARRCLDDKPPLKADAVPISLLCPANIRNCEQPAPSKTPAVEHNAPVP
jgi:hypothetical protein